MEFEDLAVECQIWPNLRRNLVRPYSVIKSPSQPLPSQSPSLSLPSPPPLTSSPALMPLRERIREERMGEERERK
ncbi:Uncharacterized protein TCM_045775 [Theobroma cacao]|uniref:Uncharacterized protein n=1 Tax=Theobroma cacao TaxID=3641 RepID=S1SI22_THECC|nr:Uncharacterized protein TCM_045775 [Theobroma cacao]